MNEKQKLRVWVTKYALTVGVQEIPSAEACFDIAPDMIKVGQHSYFHGNDWHRTRSAALVRAEEMRLAKIASLKKQLAGLEKRSFT